MKKLSIFLMAAILGGAFSYGRAQNYITISGTVTDSDNITWAGGTWQAQFVNPRGNTAYFADGSGTVVTTYQGSLNSSGAFSVSLANNNAVNPAGTMWNFTFCPNASFLCSTLANAAYTANIVISSNITSQILAPRFAATGANAYGYADVEISTTPRPGGSYFNVVSQVQRIWNGTAWYSSSTVGTINSSAQWNVPYYTISGGGSTIQGDTNFTNTPSGLTINKPLSVTNGNFTSSVPSNLTNGGTLLGTFSGTSTLSGNVTFSNLITGNISGNAATAIVASYAPYSGLTGAVPTWNQNTTGNAATATAFATNPSQCTTGYVATGIQINGTANCILAATGSGTVNSSAQYEVPYYTISGGGSTIQGDTNFTNTPSGLIINKPLSVSGNSSFTGNVTFSNIITGSINGNAATATLASEAPYSGLIGTVPIWNQSTTGNAATATAFATAPTQCSTGQYSTGINANGSANCFTPAATRQIETFELAAGFCTTANTAFAQCGTSITWPTAFADSNYSVTCNGSQPSLLGITNIFWSGKYAGGITVTIQNGDADAANAVPAPAVDCIAIHN